MTVTKNFYSHSQIRKYVTAFGTLFNNLHVQRTDENGNPLQLEHVPLTYAPKSRFIYKINQDPKLQQQPAIKLPRMAFEMTSPERDESRSHHSTRKIKINTENEQHTFEYMPIPMTFGFELTIAAKTQSELFQLVEQIIPFFDPDYAIAVRVIEDGTSFDVLVEMTGSGYDDTYEGSFEDQPRSITWTISFTMYAWLFGPTHKSPVIRQAITNLGLLNTDETLYTVTIEPTLGDGTPIEDIKPSDDFDIDKEITY